MIRIQAYKWLKERCGQLERQRDQSNLTKCQVKCRLEKRINRRDNRLDRVIEKM